MCQPDVRDKPIVAGTKYAQIFKTLSMSINEIPEKMTSTEKIEDTKGDHICLVCSIEGKHKTYRIFPI